MKKIALIADIVSSQKMKNRAEVQKKLSTILNQINKNTHLISPFTITLGDEFQAVYSNADCIFNDIWKIIHGVYPVKIRFSIGIGDITTSINRVQAIGMDGPAFYFARKGMEDLKMSAYLLNITSDDEEKLQLTKQCLYLISHFSEGWRERRIKILIMLYEGFSPKQISKRIKITDKGVYKNISAGALNIILQITKEISKQLNEIIDMK